MRRRHRRHDRAPEDLRFCNLVDRRCCRADFVADIRRWQSRSGTVKVNLALDRLPVFASHPGFDPQVHGGTIVLAESLDDIEDAFQEAVSGRPSAMPFADICIPSVFDDSLAPAGQHVMSLFTQWVPHTVRRRAGRGRAEAYADRVIARMEAVAPGFAASVLHRQVIGPHQMQQEYGLVGGNIFHGELTLGQMFHAGPPPATPTCARRCAACTRPARPPTAAAASPASPAATSSARSSPTAGPRAGAAAAVPAAGNRPRRRASSPGASPPGAPGCRFGGRGGDGFA